MPFITSDQLRDISVKAVEMFLNDKIPLSEGLAKQASAMELNADQIQRAIEATNSIAYLKVLALSDDRTVEFPLCKYAEVMQKVAVPDMDKAASYNFLEPISTLENPKPVSSELELADKKVFFTKLAAINKAELENLKDRFQVLGKEIEKVSSYITCDKDGLEKLATVSNGDEFKTLSQLVYKEEKAYNDTGIFKSAELRNVEKLQSLVKEASDIKVAIAEKQVLNDRCELLKQAFLGEALGAVGKGLGKLIGKTVTTPIKMTAGAAKRTAQNVGASMGNAAAETVNSARRAMGLPEKEIKMTPKKKFGLGAGVVTAGGIAADATMYSPGSDSTTGRSKDVWTSLQREPN